MHPRGPPTRSTAGGAATPPSHHRRTPSSTSREPFPSELLLQPCDRRCQPTHQAPAPECGVPRGPSPLPVSTIRTETASDRNASRRCSGTTPLSARTGQACIVEDQQH
ncbi:Hypothetical protein DHA2_154574 [Giardia duodenalis]|uniref:Uncharacterized protein n=1 Tax=Giardia intestinalis TaxID=5741 RepID=V6T7L7_GIAIN|nr:Hypothetical protein DHA2_154574 [Giardia intestinalis]